MMDNSLLIKTRSGSLGAKQVTQKRTSVVIDPTTGTVYDMQNEVDAQRWYRRLRKLEVKFWLVELRFHEPHGCDLVKQSGGLATEAQAVAIVQKASLNQGESLHIAGGRLSFNPLHEGDMQRRELFINKMIWPDNAMKQTALNQGLPTITPTLEDYQ